MPLPKLPGKGHLPSSIGNQHLPGKPGRPSQKPTSSGNTKRSGKSKKFRV